MLEDYTGIAWVSTKGAVLLGKAFAVDGHADRPVRVVTHIHTDHIIGLRESILFCDLIIATPATHDMLAEIGYRVPEEKRLSLSYHSPLIFSGETLTLIPSRHIPGSAQVLVEANEYRVGYTSDFKLPGTPIMRDLDVLVIESTYGKPEWRRPFKDEVEQLLVDAVVSGLGHGPVVIYGYYGKLQEVMEILRAHGIAAPFIMPQRVYKLTRIAVKHGMNIYDYHYERSREAEEIIKEGYYVYFAHMNSHTRRYSSITHIGTKIILSGWEFDSPIKKIDENTWLIAFSDHADFDDLIKYIDESRPRLLIVDSFRDGASKELAKYVRERLGINTLIAPGDGVPLHTL